MDEISFYLLRSNLCPLPHVDVPYRIAENSPPKLEFAHWRNLLLRSWLWSAGFDLEQVVETGHRRWGSEGVRLTSPRLVFAAGALGHLASE